MYALRTRLLREPATRVKIRAAQKAADKDSHFENDDDDDDPF